MKKLRWILGSVVAATAVYTAGLITEVVSWTATPHTLVVSAAASQRSGMLPPGPQQFTPADGDVPRRLDLRGNEIARPVARYRLDERGVLYEVHSPHTEVPRLKPPKL